MPKAKKTKKVVKRISSKWPTIYSTSDLPFELTDKGIGDTKDDFGYSFGRRFVPFTSLAVAVKNVLIVKSSGLQQVMVEGKHNRRNTTWSVSYTPGVTLTIGCQTFKGDSLKALMERLHKTGLIYG